MSFDGEKMLIMKCKVKIGLKTIYSLIPILSVHWSLCLCSPIKIYKTSWWVQGTVRFKFSLFYIFLKFYKKYVFYIYKNNILMFVKCTLNDNHLFFVIYLDIYIRKDSIMPEIFCVAYSIILWSCHVLDDTWVFGDTGSMSFASDEVDDRNSLCIPVVSSSVSASLTVRSNFRTDNFF